MVISDLLPVKILEIVSFLYAKPRKTKSTDLRVTSPNSMVDLRILELSDANNF